MAAVTVSVIGYCNLVLEIWDFIFIVNFPMLLTQRTYAQVFVAQCISHPEIVVNYRPGQFRRSGAEYLAVNS